jgi:hypothetical protein
MMSSSVLPLLAVLTVYLAATLLPVSFNGLVLLFRLIFIDRLGRSGATYLISSAVVVCANRMYLY